MWSGPIIWNVLTCLVVDRPAEKINPCLEDSGYVSQYLLVSFKMLLIIVTIIGDYIMPWADHRTGRHLSLQVPAEIKIELLKRKALTGAPVAYQICEALRAKWDGAGAPPVVVPGPCQSTRPVLPGKYAGMREQKITPPSPWKV